jgi:nucleotide-binding universal stress UspA family protein
MFKKILVPIDGSDLSNNAVKQACLFAKATDATLVFYYARPAYQPGYIAGDIGFGVVGLDVMNINSIKRYAAEILGHASQMAETHQVNHEKLTNEYIAPYEGIIAAADNKNCDLIFMASHGRHGVSALVLGSETQKVLTHCKIPVLVYR